MSKQVTGKFVPIITFHAIGDERSPVFMPVSTFEEQIKALAIAGYTTHPLHESLFVSAQTYRPCVICFDDCYESVYSKAFPILCHYGFTATLFIVTGFCGKTNRWPTQPHTMPEKPLMSWAQIEHLCSEGWQPGGHTITHPDLTRLSQTEITEEVFGCKRTIEEMTGLVPKAFAYPYGVSNEVVAGIVSEEFELAVGTDLGIARSDDYLFNLPRIDSFYASPHLISDLMSVRSRTYLEFRNQLRKLRATATQVLAGQR